MQSFCQGLWRTASLQMGMVLLSPYGRGTLQIFFGLLRDCFSLLTHQRWNADWVWSVLFSLLAALQICSCPGLSSRRLCQHSSRRLMYRELLKICWAEKGLVIAKSSGPYASNKASDLHSTVSSEHLMWERHSAAAWKLVIKLGEVVMWKTQPKSGHRFPAILINTTEGCSSNTSSHSSFLFFSERKVWANQK